MYSRIIGNIFIVYVELNLFKHVSHFSNNVKKSLIMRVWQLING